MSRSLLSCQCVLRAELLLDQLVEFRARQGIRDADADLVRAGGFEQVARRENVRKLLAHVAQLDEKADADACAP